MPIDSCVNFVYCELTIMLQLLEIMATEYRIVKVEMNNTLTTEYGT
jgi:hypothetical protein